MLFIKTVALLCSVTAAMAASAVISGALFVGKDTTDPSASPIEVFRDPRNHATAAASALVYAGNYVNFRPSSQKPKALSPYLEPFVRKVTASPGFVLMRNTQFSLKLDGSLTQFEKTISDQLEDPYYARALRDLVPDNIQDQLLTDWTLSLVVVNKPEGSDTVDVKLARLYLTISSDGNTATIPEQTAQLTVSDHQVATSMFVANAEMLADLIQITKGPNFVDFFTSPKSFSHGSTSCFQNRQAILPWMP
ncbi:MAG: hypothetical protein JOS17DRAFT_726664 [Linnemannia elongata]|nr:MAG: hypothetical protein JOS17DRAFT_726664 [Linnemannia elongata]